MCARLNDGLNYTVDYDARRPPVIESHARTSKTTTTTRAFGACNRFRLD